MNASPACLTLSFALLCSATPAFADVNKDRQTFEAPIAASPAEGGDTADRTPVDDDAWKADPCISDCAPKPTRLVVTLPADFGLYNFGDGGVGAGVSGDLASTRIYIVLGSGGSAFVRARRPAFRGVCGCR